VGGLLKFGPFELNAEQGKLRKLGAPVRLRRQGIRVLTCLADRPSEVVTRDELRDVLWGRQIFVDFREGLNTCVKELRTALGDDADQPRFIETVPRQGYRFIAQVERVNGTNGDSDREAAEQTAASSVPPTPTQYLDA
jgi:DNA-binding winged helix-turn-helix (wHTH) protein